MWPRIRSETEAPVTHVVLEVFEVRVRRAESRGMDQGKPEADGPKDVCLQDTPDITNAFHRPATQRNIQMETETQRTIQMETEANGPFRWTPRSQKSKNYRKVVRPFLHPNLHRHIATQSSQLPSPPTASSTKAPHPRRPKATQVPTHTVVCRTVGVCVGE